MAYSQIQSTEVTTKKPVTQALWTKVKDNFDYLKAIADAVPGIIGVPNGSFEADADVDGNPDSWTTGTYAGGTKSYESSGGIDGAKCMKFIHPGGAGNGGGYAQTDYLPVGQLIAMDFLFAYYATAAGMKCMAEVAWYDLSKALLQTDTAYSSTANPTSWSLVHLNNLALPSSSARYMRLKLIGGYTDTNVAGSVYFDDVRIVSAAPGRAIIPISETWNPSGYASGGGMYTDAGPSGSLTIPSWAKWLSVYTSLCCENGSGVPLVRFRIGTNYSTVNTAYSPGAMSYVPGTEMTLDVSALAGAQTVQMQVQDVNGRTFFNSTSGYRKGYKCRLRSVNFMQNATPTDL